MKGKKFFTGLTCAALLAAPSAALADSTDVNLIVNNAYVGSSEVDGQVYVSNAGRTMIPLRLVSETLDYTTDWQPDGSIHVTSADGSVDVTLQVGSTAYEANGTAGTFETAPILKNDRTYLPARDFTELYGDIFWDNDTRTVWIAQGQDLQYQAIGDKFMRADANGIQQVMLPEGYTLYGGMDFEPIVAQRTINGTSYIALHCDKDHYYNKDNYYSTVPLFRDDGVSLFRIGETYPSSFYVSDTTIYYTDGVNAGPWHNPVNPYVLYTSGINTPDSLSQTIRHKMDFVVNDCTLDMVDGVLTATSPDGTVHRVDDLSKYPASIDGVGWD